MLKLLRYKNSQNHQKVVEVPNSGSQVKDSTCYENEDIGRKASPRKCAGNVNVGNLADPQQLKVGAKKSGAITRVTASWNHRPSNSLPSRKPSDEEEEGDFFGHNDVKFGRQNLSHYILGDVEESKNVDYVFQGLATCIVAFGELYNTPVLKWNPQILDGILVQGRKLFNKSARENGGTIMAREHVAKNFTLGNNMMEVYLSEPVVMGALHSSNPRVYNIDVGLDMLLQSYDYCLCEISGEYFLIWKHLGSYFIYDCYGRSPTLDRDVNSGSAAIICVGAISTISALFRLKTGMKTSALYTLHALQMQVMRPCADRRKMRMVKVRRKSNYYPVGPDHAILEGRSGALAEYFKDARCKHSLTIALVGILYSKVTAPSSWDASAVESIVKMGHNLYEKSVKYDPNNRLVFGNIPQAIPIGESLVEFELIPSTTKRIWSKGGVFDAHEGLEQIKHTLVENNSANLLIQVDQRSYGLFEREGHYYVLDPYPSQKMGNTVVHTFNTIQSLCRALVEVIIPIPYSSTYLLHFVDVLNVNSPYEQDLLQLIKDALAGRSQRSKTDGSPSRGKRRKSKKLCRKRGRIPNVAATRVAAVRTARCLNSKKNKVKSDVDSDDTSKYQSAELTDDLETARSALEQLQRYSDTEKQYATASSSEKDSNASEVFSGDSSQLPNNPRKLSRAMLTRTNSSEDNVHEPSQDGNFQFRFRASKRIVRMVTSAAKTKKKMIWKRSCRYLTASCSCEKFGSLTKLARNVGNGRARPSKQQAYIRAVCGRTTSLRRHRGKISGTESEGATASSRGSLCEDPSLNSAPNEEDCLSSFEKSCLSVDGSNGPVIDTNTNLDLSEAHKRNQNCEFNNVSGDGPNNVHHLCMTHESCNPALPGITKSSQKNSPRHADSISGQKHELIAGNKDLFAFDQSMAVVGSATGSYDSLQALMVAGFRVTDRILIMTPWGNYVAFKHGLNFFLHEGCTCHPERFRLLNLEMGTAGLLQFPTMHDLMLKILHGNFAEGSGRPRNGKIEYYSCRGACANSYFNSHILN